MLLPSRTNVSQMGNDVSLTNPRARAPLLGHAAPNDSHLLENFAVGMEIDNVCDTMTFKKSKTDQGATIEEFIYTYNCVPEWKTEFFEKEGIRKIVAELSSKIKEEVQENEIQPPLYDVFKAFTVPPNNVKVIIVGQDPTPQPGKATGMAFSLSPDEDPRNVPSVLNMLVELKLEGFEVSLSNGDLTPWVNEGVLLLNTALTIRLGENATGSHLRIWKPFTDKLVEHMSNRNGHPVAWILWGVQAKTSCKNVNKNRNFCKEGGHPSPRGASMSAFFGGNYFTEVNEFLTKAGQGKINWTLPHPEGAGPDMLPCQLDEGVSSQGGTPMEGVEQGPIQATYEVI